MHPTAKQNCKEFYQAYHPDMLKQNSDYQIIEIGSQNVNGSLRDVFPPGIQYTGVDFVEGKGVDVILADPYVLPFADNSADVILSSSVFEHSEMFWVLFLEIMRVLKPHGVFYLNVPSNGDIHKWPVDCWRLYPDAGKALVTWAKRNGINAGLLESYTSRQSVGDIWNDFVAVFVKDDSYVKSFPNRILDSKVDFWNGYLYGSDVVLRPASITEDQKRLEVIRKVTTGDINVS
jgi:SAM-dependent methyltransferase